MDAIEALKSRRAIRSFKPDPVPRELLEDIVDCGRLAASAINIQPCEFVVVTGAELRRDIAEATDYGKFIAQAPACIVVLARPTAYYLEDGSAATQNLLLAARAHGLGACWVAGDKKHYAAEVVRLVGAPEDHRLVSLVPLGHPAEPHPSKPKRPLADVLHWEKLRR